MNVSIDLSYCTTDCVGAVGQTLEVFGAQFAKAAMEISASPNIHKLVVGLDIANPLSNMSNSPLGNEFNVASGTYFASAVLDYEDWVEPDWQRRVLALAAGVRRALEAKGPIALGIDERVTLVRAAERAAGVAQTTPPQALAPLEPVYLVFTGDHPRPGVGFTKPAHMSFGAWRFVEVLPPDARANALKYFANLPDAPEMFKLHRRDAVGLAYYEAWPEGEHVIVHWGICGQHGQTKQHDASDDNAKLVLLAELRARAIGDGYFDIPASEQRGIVATRYVAGGGSEADLDLRYELQEALDERFGWTGLGHCDGGETGGGSMAVYCYVVDVALGMAAIKDELAQPKFRGFVATMSR